MERPVRQVDRRRPGLTPAKGHPDAPARRLFHRRARSPSQRRCGGDLVGAAAALSSGPGILCRWRAARSRARSAQRRWRAREGRGAGRSAGSAKAGRASCSRSCSGRASPSAASARPRSLPSTRPATLVEWRALNGPGPRDGSRRWHVRLTTACGPDKTPTLRQSPCIPKLVVVESVKSQHASCALER